MAAPSSAASTADFGAQSAASTGSGGFAQACPAGVGSVASSDTTDSTPAGLPAAAVAVVAAVAAQPAGAATSPPSVATSSYSKVPQRPRSTSSPRRATPSVAPARDRGPPSGPMGAGGPPPVDSADSAVTMATLSSDRGNTSGASRTSLANPGGPLSSEVGAHEGGWAVFRTSLDPSGQGAAEIPRPSTDTGTTPSTVPNVYLTPPTPRDPATPGEPGESRVASGAGVPRNAGGVSSELAERSASDRFLDGPQAQNSDPSTQGGALAPSQPSSLTNGDPLTAEQRMEVETQRVKREVGEGLPSLPYSKHSSPPPSVRWGMSRFQILPFLRTSSSSRWLLLLRLRS